MTATYKLPRQAVHICQRSETVAVETSQCHDFEAMVSANKSLARDVCALQKQLAVDEQEKLSKDNE